MTTYRRPAIYFYVIDFPIMSNWNIVCNTNTHHILQYCYDIVINNIYTQKLVSSGVSYLLYLFAVYPKPNTTITITITT